MSTPLKRHAALLEAIRDPEVDNIVLAEGALDGVKCSFLIHEKDDGEDVPVAILLTPALVKALRMDVDEEDEEEEEEKPRRKGWQG